MRAYRPKIPKLAQIAAVTILTCVSAGPLQATTPAQFERNLRSLQPVCLHASSKACVANSWKLVDQDGDQRLSLLELDNFHRDLKTWLAWPEQSLPQKSRNSVLLGSFIVTTVGLPHLFASYDSNADGYLSQEEALADITLDERPIGEVLRDPKSLDRKALAARLGPINGFLQPVFDE